MPRGFVEGSPKFTICLFWVAQKSDPSSCSQQNPMEWYSLFYFFRHWHHLLRFFSFLLLLIFFSLLPQFSLPSFIALFSLCFHLPTLCSSDSFLFKNHSLWPVSFQSFWSFFLFPNNFPSSIHSFPSHPLPPPDWGCFCFTLGRGKSILWSFQYDDCGSGHLFPHFALGQASVDGQGSMREHIQFSVTNQNYSFSFVHSALLGCPWYVMPWEKMMN